MPFCTLVINPGSTSTKMGVFEDENLLFQETLRHNDGELKSFPSVIGQKEFRKEAILRFLKAKGFDLSRLSAVVGRGGLLKPLTSGTYGIDEGMLQELRESKRGEHASNLGGILAYELAAPYRLPAYIVDPVSVTEYTPVAYYTGLKEITRQSLSHALNTKAVAKRYAKSLGRDYSSLRLLVVHLGGGITVSAHRDGLMVDATNCQDEGCFTPERSGTVPCVQLAKLCFSGQYTLPDVIRMLFREGGLYNYLGTKDFSEVMRRVHAGDEKAREVVEAMIYQIAKDIGAMATVLEGRVDALLLTGGMAYDGELVEALKAKVGFLTKNIIVYPGEDELQALNEGALRVLRGEEKEKIYG